MKYVVGIDEAGRGPLAGPVAVGAAMVPVDFDKKFFKSIQDSKKLSKEDREKWYRLAEEAHKSGKLDYAVSLVSERVIDRHGIAYALRLGIKRCLDKLGAEADSSQIFLDGALKAPAKYKQQSTVIKGDEKIPVISLASILAKVTRDKKMVAYARLYPQFKFEVHKGYGTLAHRQALIKYGPTAVHRRTFIRRLTTGE